MEILSYISPVDQQVIHATFFQHKQAKGLIVMFHGMAEHRHRYQAVAMFFQQHGYAVLTLDHRGHGDSPYDGSVYGHFANKDGWFTNIEDLHAIITQTCKDHQLTNVILFAHSMGSLVALSYIKRYGQDLHGLILSGIPKAPPMIGLIEKMINWVALSNPLKESKLLFTMTFGAFDKKDKGTIKNSWLSVNLDNVQAYNNDPICGFAFSKKAAHDLMVGIKDAHDFRHYPILENLQVMLLKGQHDVTTSNKTYQNIEQALTKIGCQVIIDESLNSKHEVLFDLNRGNVLKQLLIWINNLNS